jgi:hypothetical protein
MLLALTMPAPGQSNHWVVTGTARNESANKFVDGRIKSG